LSDDAETIFKLIELLNDKNPVHTITFSSKSYEKRKTIEEIAEKINISVCERFLTDI